MMSVGKLQNRYGSGLNGVAFGAVAAALVLLAGVFVVRSEPRAEVELRLADGSVWLPSLAIGGVSLLDGSSGSIATSLGVAEQGEQFEVVQWGSDAILVNESVGTVSRLDGANWSIATGRVQFGEPGSDLDVIAGRTSGWLVQSGSVAPLNLETLEQREAAPVSGRLSEGLVADDGSLLYSSQEPDIALRRFSSEDGDVITISEMTGPVALRDLGDKNVGVDLDDQRVWLEGSGVVCSRLEFPDGADLGVGGGDGQLLIVSDQGGLMMWSPEDSGCPTSDDFLSMDAGTYGQPAVTDGWGVVPDFGRSEVVVVDLDTREIVARQAVPGLTQGSTFELVAETGSVWFNDPASTVAGLIRRNGEVIPVAKYEQGSDTGFVAAPVDDPDADSQAVALGGRGANSDGAAPDASQDIANDNGDEPTQPPVTQPEVEPLGPTVEGPSPTQPAPAPKPTDPTQPGETTPTSAQPPETTPPIIDIELASTASQVNAGEAITFQSVTLTGNPRFFDLRVSPDNGSLGGIISFGRFDYTFPVAGDYLVTLEACDPDGFCDSETVAVKVIPSNTVVELVSAITAPGQVTVGVPVTLFDASQGEPASWAWSFAEGTPATSSAQNPSVSFATTGTKTVDLTVTHDDGRTDTTTINVDVVAKAPPYLLTIVGDSTVQVGQLSGYSVTTTNPNGTPNPHWNVQGADTVTPNGTSLEASWSAAGTYEITISTNAGAIDGEGSLLVTVTDPPPVADAPSISVNGPATLDTGQTGNWSVNNSGGTIADYAWMIDGGITGSNATISHAFNTPGTYLVSITASGPGGSDAAQRTITVADPAPTASPFGVTCNQPTVAAGTLTGCQLAGDPADFLNFSWFIAWPDPAQAQSWLMNPYRMDIQYDVPGTVTLTLTAQDVATGLTVSTSASVTFTGTTTTTTQPTTTTTQPTTTTTQPTTTTTAAPAPAPFGLACPKPVAAGNISYCQLVGTPSNFTGFSFSIAWPNPALANSWTGDPWGMNVGYSEAASFTVTIHATDVGTGQAVSASDTVIFQ